MKRFLFLLALWGAAASRLSAQDFDPEVWHKWSPELRLTIDKGKWDLRFRPIDHIEPFGLGRTDIILGKTFGKLTLFSYTKVDYFRRQPAESLESPWGIGRAWTGIRADYNTSAFAGKLLVQLQGRYYWTLNDKARDHFQIVQYVRWQVTPQYHFGFLSIFLQDVPYDTPNWFLGPSLHVMSDSRLSFLLAYLPDWYAEHRYMAYLRIGYRIRL